MPFSQSLHKQRLLFLLLINPLIYGMATAAIVWKSGSMSSHLDTSLPDSAAQQPIESSVVEASNAAGSVDDQLLSFSVWSFSGAVVITSTCLATVVAKNAKDMSLADMDARDYSKRVHRFSVEIANVAQQTSISIEEIARSSQIAASSLQEALRQAEHSSDVVRSLGDHTDSVTDLVGEITSISEQTNLLALNATIEAARAGESGKGFSVVANEVKQLANDTRLTSQRVIDRVRCIQSSGNETMSTTVEALALMKQCADCQSAISSAVEEQRTIAAQLARQAAELASEAGREPENAIRPFVADEYTSRVADRPVFQSDGKKPARRRHIQSVSNSFTT